MTNLKDIAENIKKNNLDAALNLCDLYDDIKNISGATLSCRNLTDGVNRITESWNQVLRYL